MNPLIRITFGLLFGLTVSFIVTGYQAILPVLIDEGAFSDLCGSSNDCDDQLNRLNLMYTISMTVLNMMTLPVGILIGKVGPMLMSMFGCVLISTGSVIMALSSPTFQGWFYGYVIMAAGGPAVAFPMFTLPSLYPKKQGLLFSLIVAMFDASAIVMYIFQILYTYTGASTKELFSIYLIFPCGLFVTAPLIFDRTIPFLNKKNDNEEKNIQTGSEQKKDMPPCDGTSLKKVVSAVPFYILIAWCGAFVTTKYFYITNLNSQLLWITNGDADKSSIGTQVFSILLPLAGIFTPITAFLLDKTPLSLSTIILGILTFIVGLISIIPNYYIQYVTIIGIVFGRFYFFSTAPLLVSKLYGVNGPGIYGIVNFIAACINLTNFIWSYLCVKNNNNFYIFNPGLSFTCLIASILISLLLRRVGKKQQRETELLNEC